MLGACKVGVPLARPSNNRPRWRDDATDGRRAISPLSASTSRLSALLVKPAYTTSSRANRIERRLSRGYGDHVDTPQASSRLARPSSLGQSPSAAQHSVVAVFFRYPGGLWNVYKPGGTIADALGAIQRKDYVLPAIQREFVWKPEQIERLFDSLMQGYPFGTFLFWKVRPETSSRFKFYDFVLNYHQRDAAHCPDLGPVHNREVTAVLDGQQRLTALNIGLRGSMATKLPHRLWTSPDAFPVKRLRLNLLAPVKPDEHGVCYEFRFLTDDQAGHSGGRFWFPVGSVLGMKGGPDMLKALQKEGLQGDELGLAYETLDRLYSVIGSVAQIA